MIIKEKLRSSDEETVEQIRENPYLQYFLGLKQYEDNAVFHSTMFVHFRKRFPEDIIRINDLTAEKAVSEKKQAKKNPTKMILRVPAKEITANCWLMRPMPRRISITRLI